MNTRPKFIGLLLAAGFTLTVSGASNAATPASKVSKSGLTLAKGKAE